MPVRYRFICDAQSIFDLKMLPESSEARFRRYSPFSGVAAIHLRRTAPASGVKPAGQNMESWLVDTFNSRILQGKGGHFIIFPPGRGGINISLIPSGEEKSAACRTPGAFRFETVSEAASGVERSETPPRWRKRETCGPEYRVLAGRYFQQRNALVGTPPSCMDGA